MTPTRIPPTRPGDIPRALKIIVTTTATTLITFTSRTGPSRLTRAITVILSHHLHLEPSPDHLWAAGGFGRLASAHTRMSFPPTGIPPTVIIPTTPTSIPTMVTTCSSH